MYGLSCFCCGMCVALLRQQAGHAHETGPPTHDCPNSRPGRGTAGCPGRATNPGPIRLAEESVDPGSGLHPPDRRGDHPEKTIHQATLEDFFAYLGQQDPLAIRILVSADMEKETTLRDSIRRASEKAMPGLPEGFLKFVPAYEARTGGCGTIEAGSPCAGRPIRRE